MDSLSEYATTLWSIMIDSISSGGVRYARPPATVFDPFVCLPEDEDRAELPIRWNTTRDPLEWVTRGILKGLQKVAVGRRTAAHPRLA